MGTQNNGQPQHWSLQKQQCCPCPTTSKAQQGIEDAMRKFEDAMRENDPWKIGGAMREYEDAMREYEDARKWSQSNDIKLEQGQIGDASEALLIQYQAAESSGMMQSSGNPMLGSETQPSSLTFIPAVI